MSSRVRKHIRGNVVGYLALFLVLTGGTAQALNGSNTVFSDDIVNRDVKTADLGFKSVTANRLAPNSVRSGRVVDDSLTGADVSGHRRRPLRNARDRPTPIERRRRIRGAEQLSRRRRH